MGADAKTEDDDPTGWKTLHRLTGLWKHGPRFWGAVAGEVEALVSSRGIVLCKEYSQRGHKLGLPWIELTEDELRGILARGEELLAALRAEKALEASEPKDASS